VDGVAEKMERKRSKETMDFRLGACCDEISELAVPVRGSAVRETHLCLFSFAFLQVM